MAFYAPHPLRKSHAAVSPMDGGSVAATQATEVVKKPAQKNSSRERMQAELASLRVEASRLEQELMQLRRRRGKCARGVGWMEEAERQRSERVRAEMHNRRLRELTQTHSDDWGAFYDEVNARVRGVVTMIEHAQVLPRDMESLAQSMSRREPWRLES